MVDVVGVDLKMLEMPPLPPWNREVEEEFLAELRKPSPSPPPRREGDSVSTPGLVPDDGSSQRWVTSTRSYCARAPETDSCCRSSSTPPCTPLIPQHYEFAPHSPQYDYTGCGPLHSPTLSVSSNSSSFSMPALIESPCAGGKPIKQNDGGYRCPVCGKPFKRLDDAKRHTNTAGSKVQCKYCLKYISNRFDNQSRHLEKKKCAGAWEAGYRAGRFTEHSVEDAFRYN